MFGWGQGWCADFPLGGRMTLSPFIHTDEKRTCLSCDNHQQADPMQLPEEHYNLSFLCSDWPYMEVLYNININCKVIK